MSCWGKSEHALPAGEENGPVWVDDGTGNLCAHKKSVSPWDYGSALPRHTNRLWRKKRRVSRRQPKSLCCLYALLHLAVWVHNQHLQNSSG